MRFSHQYEQHKIPEWASKYIRYAFLLAVLKPLYSTSKLKVTESVSAIKIPLMTFLRSSTTRSSMIAAANIRFQGAEDLFSDTEDPIVAWVQLLKADCDKLLRFYELKLREFTAELEEIVEFVARNLKEIDELLLLSDHQDPRVRVSSLQRAIQSCHRHFWNLEVFLEVNSLALKRLIIKLQKASPLDEFLTLAEDYEKQLVAGRRVTSQQRKQIYAFASEQITHSPIPATKKFFRRAEVTYNPSDIRIIAFCHGMSLIALSVSIYSISQLDLIDPMVPSFCVYRLIACFMSLLWVGSVVLYVFDYYEINWLSVFEIRRKTAITFIKLMMTASVWTAVICVPFMVHTIFLSKGDAQAANAVALVSFVLFLVIWLLPMQIVHLHVRKEMAMVLWNILVSPFGKVQFAHFFTADVLTSLSKPLADIYRCFCFFGSSSWLDNTPGNCNSEIYWIYSFSVLPYVWRFLQCWNRYYYTRQWFPHLVNAGKYSMGIATVSVSYFEQVFFPNDNRILFITISIAATLYMLVWDTLMDFGFRRFFTAEGRKQKMYPDGIYYYVFFTNIILRSTWILTMMPKVWLVNAYLQVEVLLLFISLLEILRRGQWTLLRVENEKFSNIEKYRNDDFVPKMPKIVLDD